MYNSETEFILLMLGISDSQYRVTLYQIAEAWEDRHGLRELYVHEPFRAWWILRSNNLNALFFSAIFYRNGELTLHIRDQRGDHFIESKEAIRRHYWNYLKSRLVMTPFDNTLLRLIDFKTKKVKSA